ncbi:hypothetical protein T10_1077 [Trichinella papuae]|uniref:Transmembrane protein n=1 Tax=Trichinella papuae TaxID=268474 RepID=A0A0V1N429_9BILA|nr:hypothetical protein T10_1077 [Trichinella papuae]
MENFSLKNPFTTSEQLQVRQPDRQRAREAGLIITTMLRILIVKVETGTTVSNFVAVVVAIVASTAVCCVCICVSKEGESSDDDYDGKEEKERERDRERDK